MGNVSAHQKGAIMGGVAPSGAGQARRLWRGLVLAICVTIALPALATGRLVIPFDLDEYDRPIVDLTLENGVTATGVLDTAATLTLIEGRTAHAVGLSPVEIRPGEPQLITVLGLGGPEDFPLLKLQSLSAGNVHLGVLNAALDTSPAVEGVLNILPVSVLEANVLDFDFRKETLTLYDGSPNGRRSGRVCKTDLHEVSGLFYVDVEINNVKGRALIDTGSSITYINSHFADLSNTVTNKEKTKQLLGLTGEEYDVRIARVSTLSLGQMELTRLDLLVSDPALFTYLEFQDQPVMVLGMDFLSHFRMQLDRRNDSFILRRERLDCLICSTAHVSRID
ncbi:hypothetical protein HY3_06465 [Hyphomonas pacifica]|uniref:Uncharacterized protein n=1 Tax=Hyphomonas pacifica TaxID=1280941 RepID=A0A062TV94_9PROT|nr:hypothetical protein HY2_05490 [Hyphomonas pacifica]RAN30455.1 hypothetical protein HY3_06465 [Hyphomonas pacifica]